ncbi:MAG: alpha/beta hydrolase [Clostridia bacterium]|nr:alpha/beta hydrolase [Clostridia bacterium]MDE7306125.1 alpha/beta hydrolase [Clostridia bacterium]
MVDSWEIEIPSLTGKRLRKAYIYLPVGYDESDRRYPVMYMFDGHNLFFDEEATYGKSWGLADYLDYTETPLIVAAVECNTVGNGRLSEYSPVDFTMHGGERIKGKGKKYMDWLTKTFKPFIDENFRTLPDRANTAIGGSSMGGLMTIYALSAYNRYFSRGAALSPSLWVEDGEIPAFVQKAKFGKNTVLYTDYGSKEFSNHGVQKQVFANTCAYLINKNVLLTSRIVPDGDHSEASWERQIPYFMAALGFNAEN